MTATSSLTASETRHGFERSPATVCPHCNTKGYVVTRRTEIMPGVPHGKVIGTQFMAGISLTHSGLARTEEVTEAHCHNCGSEWFF